VELLEKNSKKIIDYLNRLKIRYELIIAEDGSTDGTDIVAKNVEHKYKNVKTISFRSKLGRGKAIKNALEIATGKKIIYIDIDLPIRIKDIKKMLDCLDTYTIAIGSRYTKGSKLRRTISRYVLSHLYITAVKILFGCQIKDFQCGFKGFDSCSLRELNEGTTSDDYFWDTEIILKACRKGVSVFEMPIEWVEKKSFRRIEYMDIVSRIRMLQELIRFKLTYE
jgi:glycosyltransferase involved in cell wall biosynthesis